MALLGYEVYGSESAIHTVVVPDASSDNETQTGSAANTYDGVWHANTWASNGNGGSWMKFDFTTPQEIQAIKFQATVTPTAIEGSDNDSDWTACSWSGGAQLSAVGGVGQFFIVFDAAETYRYYRLSYATWKTVVEVEFVAAYTPGDLRFWGPNPYQGNGAHQAFDENTSTTYYADGGSSHRVGWMFTGTTTLASVTIRLFWTGNVTLEVSDDGLSWANSDVDIPCVDDVDKVITPSDNGHQYWRIQIGTWKQIREISYAVASGSGTLYDADLFGPGHILYT